MVAKAVRRGADAPLWRAAEVGVLRNRIERVRTGTGGVLLIEGEAGAGRSTLLAEAAELARPNGVTVLGAGADELSAHFPLLVLQDALGDESLTSVEQLTTQVKELVAAGPVLLFLDDLQWADTSTLLAWYRLARLARSGALLLVATLRPVPHREELQQLRRALASGGAEVMTLAPLAEAVVRAAVLKVGQQTGAMQPDRVTMALAARTGGKTGSMLPDRAAMALAQRTGGNARYLADLVDALTTSVQTGLPRATSASHLPPGLAANLELRLGYLSPAEHETLRTAALLGDEFSVAELASHSPIPPAELADVIEHLCALGLLTEAPQGLRFRHPILRDALLEKRSATVELLGPQPLACVDKSEPASTRPPTPDQEPNPHLRATGPTSVPRHALSVPQQQPRTHGRAQRKGRPRAETGWSALTRTELCVAGFVAEGHTNADIASQLHVSRRTVEGHVSHILAKLGLRSRVELARDAGRRKPPLAI